MGRMDTDRGLGSVVPDEVGKAGEVAEPRLQAVDVLDRLQSAQVACVRLVSCKGRTVGEG